MPTVEMPTVDVTAVPNTAVRFVKDVLKTTGAALLKWQIVYG